MPSRSTDSEVDELEGDELVLVVALALTLFLAGLDSGLLVVFIAAAEVVPYLSTLKMAELAILLMHAFFPKKTPSSNSASDKRC